ncbi:MAG TPA: hypothetical protein VJJ28_02115 [Candidatus Paceibacterota bacterium]
MQKKSSKKPIIIVIVILTLIALTYFYFSGSPTDSSPSLTSDESAKSSAQIVGAQVLVLLNQLNSLNIETKIFDTPVYKSLVDHTVTVLEQRVGKPNPFASSFGGFFPPVSTSTRTR